MLHIISDRIVDKKLLKKTILNIEYIVKIQTYAKQTLKVKNLKNS